MPESCLYVGEVMHCRKRPVRHRFVYRVFSLLLDLDEMPQVAARLRWFSHNRFNLFSFHDRDHGSRDGAALRPWVERQLARHGIALAGGKIYLHCFPRMLGYVFNPISVYWCYAADGTLRAMLYEVKNTFGEQHAYVLPVAPGHPAAAPIRQSAAKQFHVSPFIDMNAVYRFRVVEPEERLSILIRESVTEGELLIATHTARRRVLSDGALLRAFAAFPLLTLRVVTAIHWQALRLWLKGVRLYRHPGTAKRPREATP